MSSVILKQLLYFLEPQFIAVGIHIGFQQFQSIGQLRFEVEGPQTGVQNGVQTEVQYLRF